MQLVSLLSGGIDSGVATALALQAGHRVLCIHFHQNAQPVNKIERLVLALKSHGSVKLCLVPFSELQLELIKFVPAQLRVLCYRRAMLRIAEAIAKERGCSGIITGDSIGQVASQTVENIATCWSAVSMPIFAPLLGWDKAEIVAKAKQLGTYEISIQPYSDCCSFLISRHPATKSTPVQLERFERAAGLPRLCELAVARAVYLT